MPTLLSSQSTQHYHDAIMHSADVSPAGTTGTADDATTAPAIILSFNGVDFKLSSMTSSSEVSYKNESDNLILSLTGFTGTLMVSKTMMTSSSSGIIANTSTSDVTSTTGTTSRTVEDDTNSPETKTETAKKSKKVSPGQQTLPFMTTGATTAVTKKSSKTKSKKTKKRTTVALAEKTPANSKRSRTTNAINTSATTTNSTSIDSFLPPISMGQASQATQPTQLEDDGTDVAAEDEDDVRVITATDTTTSMMMMETNETKKKTNAWNSPSVQDILDGSDSVATVRDGDDDDINIDIDADDNTKTMEDPGDDNNNEDDVDNGVAINDIVINSSESATTEGIIYPNPPARWGHTMTRVEKDKILVYGGASYDTNGDPIILSDVHVYDPKNGGSWHAPINCRGEARQWHSSTYIPGRQQIIAFGGEQTNNKGKTITSDTLRVLDTEIMLWYPPAVVRLLFHFTIIYLFNFFFWKEDI